MTSIYWYFRKKDDLLDEMTGRALRRYQLATAFVDADKWRDSLQRHAREMRAAIRSLVVAGLIPEHAFDTYAAVALRACCFRGLRRWPLPCTN